MKQITLLVILISLLLAACTEVNTLVDNETAKITGLSRSNTFLFDTVSVNGIALGNSAESTKVLINDSETNIDIISVNPTKLIFVPKQAITNGNLSLEVDFVKTNPDFKNFYKSDERSVSCFASSARYELTHDNKKIVGSAQRIFGNKLLQHGSILIDYGFEQIADYTTEDPEKANRLKDFTLKTAIPINAIAPQIINVESLIDSFQTTFEQLNILA